MSRARAVLLGGLVLALLGAVIAAGAIGAYPVAPSQVAGSILAHLGIHLGPQPDQIGEAVLWEVRFPRVVLAVLVGASLSVAGALMQGVFGNPLAEPGVVGVSSGAAVGAASAIVLGVAPFGSWTITIAAFVGGLATTFLVYSTSRRDGRAEVVTLLLTGIAVNAFAGAAIGLLTFLADDAELRSITFWNLGSLSSATWSTVLAVLPFAVLGMVLAPMCARGLDLLALGERPAGHLGLDVERLRLLVITLVALLTAAAVAVAGIITFVGLVVPHIVRLVAGPGHRYLIPVSAVGGAFVLVVGDLAARTLAAPAEIPLGVLTALIGSPVFFMLLRRTRSRQGGWA